MLDKYTKPISIGVVLLFIIIPLIVPIPAISYLLLNLDEYFNENYYAISQVVFFLESILFIIGMFFLSFGAVRTMLVPLTFSKEKHVIRIQRKSTKTCPKCGIQNTVSAQFCIYCGYKI